MDLYQVFSNYAPPAPGVTKDMARCNSWQWLYRGNIILQKHGYKQLTQMQKELISKTFNADDATNNVRKGARYNQVPHPTQDTDGKVKQITVRHHEREPRGRPFPSRWP